MKVMQTLICYLLYIEGEDLDKHELFFKNIFTFQIMTVIVLSL